MKFSNNLKKYREQSGLTQESLAEKLFITRQSISKWENGSAEPSIEVLLKLAEIFDVSVDELLKGNEPTEKVDKKIKSTFRKLMLVNFGLAIFTFLTSFIIVQMLPETLPMQFDFMGNVTRFGSRWEMVFLGAIPFVIVLAQLWFRHAVKKTPKKHLKGFKAGICVLIAVNILFLAMLISYGFIYGENLQTNSIIFGTAIFYVAFILLSVFSHPYFNKQNAIFGFKTIFTLTNNDAWVKVNKMQSITGFIASVLAYLITVIAFKAWTVYLVGLIIISIIPSIIYHEVLRFKHLKEKKNRK